MESSADAVVATVTPKTWTQRVSSQLRIWLPTIAAMAAAAIALIGVFAANDATRDRALEDRRAEAYPAYFADLARFNEYIWNTTPWAGNGAPNPAPPDSAAFYTTGMEMQSELEESYATAILVASDEEIIAGLQKLHSLQQDLFFEFKCTGGLQEECSGVAKASHDRVITLVTDWSAESEATKADLVVLMRAELTK